MDNNLRIPKEENCASLTPKVALIQVHVWPHRIIVYNSLTNYRDTDEHNRLWTRVQLLENQ